MLILQCVCVCVCVYIYTYSALVYSIYRQKQMNYREERDYLININMNQNVLPGTNTFR